MKKRAIKSAVIVIEVIAVAVAIIAAALFFLFWRVGEKPLSLDLLRPSIELAIKANLPPGYDARIASMEIKRAAPQGVYELRFSDVVIMDAEDQKAADAPAMVMTFGLGDLLGGRVGPQTIAVDGASFRIVRRENLSVEIPIVKKQQQNRNGLSLQTLLNGGLLKSAFQSAVISHAELSFMDVASGREWTAPNSDVQLLKTEEGLTARIHGMIDMGGERAGIDATANYVKESRVVDVVADGENFPVGDLLSTFYGENAAIVDAPVSGRAVMSFTASGDVLSSEFTAKLGEGALILGGERRQLKMASWDTGFDPATNRFTIDQFDFDVEGARGGLSGEVSITFGDDIRKPERISYQLESAEIVLSLPDQLPGDLPLTEISLAGVYDVADRRLSVDALQVEVAGLRASGNVSLLRTRETAGQSSPSPGVIADIDIEGAVSPEGLLTFWPRSLASGARDWVDDRLATADISNLDFVMNLAPGAITEDGGLPDDALTLTFDARNAKAFFVKQMTPLRNGSGSGVLRGNSFTLTIDRADVGDVKISKGEVSFPVFIPKWLPTYYRFTADGDAQSMLSILDEAPLSLLSKVDLAPDQFEGAAHAVVEVMRPNKRDVLPEEYGFKGKADFTNMTLHELIGDLEITGASGVVDLQTRSLKVEANASLVSGAPIKMIWRQNFFAQDGPSDILLSGVFDASTGDLFGVSARQFLRGPVGFEAHATGDLGVFQTLDVKADFTDATLSVDALGWRKPDGVKALGDISMAFSDEGAAVNALSLSGEGIDIGGSLAFDGQGALQLADLRRFFLDGAADISIMAKRDGAGVLALSIVGPFLNAGSMIQQTLESGDAKDGAPFDWGAGVGVQARIDEVEVRNGVRYLNSALDLSRNAERLQALNFSAFGADGRPLTVTMELTGAEAGSQRAIEARTSALGEFMSGVFGVRSVARGEGSMRIMLHPSGEPGFEGEIEARNLQVVNAPLLARIFSAGSLDGLANLMNGEGIDFSYAYGQFDFAKGVVSVKDMHATGSSVGITADGYIDFSPDGGADLNGAVAPLYMLNSVLGNAPLIGDLLVGKKGEGLVAFTYRVNGATENPTVFVNPLSALTPGIFRRLMQPARAVKPEDPVEDVTEGTPAEGAVQ